MKKMYIFFLLLFFAFGSIILVNTNKKEYLKKDGIILALTLDGEEIFEYPDYSTGDYTVEVNCTNAVGTWKPTKNSETQDYEWNLLVEDISGNVICNLDFKTKTENDKLSNIVKQEAYSTFYGEVNDKANYTNLQLAAYGTPNIYIGSYAYSTSGTATTGVFQFENSKWNNIPTEMTSNQYYHFGITIVSAGYYQLCYTVASGDASNILYINGTSDYIKASDSEQTGCRDLGYLNKNEIVKIVNKSGNIISPISFDLETTEDYEKINTGYRYNGKKPNNYIIFNNEIWRIIGNIPTCTNSNCSTKEDLVKIIREMPIGHIAYDASNTDYTRLKGTWGENTLYFLLNNYYYGKKDATNSGYCYIDGSTSSQGYCNYQINGLTTSDYYGKMLKKVYWSTGCSSDSYTPLESYLNEIKKQGVFNYIGLLAPSDWGYAADSSYHKKTLYSNSSNSTKENFTWTNWMVGNGGEWMGICSSYYSNGAFRANNSGDLTDSTGLGGGMHVRPVVYLDSSVYIVSGNGSESNPYIIAM